VTEFKSLPHPILWRVDELIHKKNAFFFDNFVIKNYVVLVVVKNMLFKKNEANIFLVKQAYVKNPTPSTNKKNIFNKFNNQNKRKRSYFF